MLEKSFGFAAKKWETDDYQRIPDFVSCRKCFKTYSYTSTTGTRQLNRVVKMFSDFAISVQ